MDIDKRNGNGNDDNEILTKCTDFKFITYNTILNEDFVGIYVFL